MRPVGNKSHTFLRRRALLEPPILSRHSLSKPSPLVQVGILNLSNSERSLNTISCRNIEISSEAMLPSGFAIPELIVARRRSSAHFPTHAATPNGAPFTFFSLELHQLAVTA
jgi:hypothetical protein